jgi:hypothetical protein
VEAMRPSPDFSFPEVTSMLDIPSETNHDQIPSVAGTLQVVKRAAQDGALDAREAAERTWAATSLFVSRLVYTTCYTVSYGVIFPAALVARVIPKNNVAVQGLIDGAQAAKQKVEELHGPSLETPGIASIPAI